MVVLQPFDEEILIPYLPWAKLLTYLNCHIIQIVIWTNILEIPYISILESLTNFVI